MVWIQRVILLCIGIIGLFVISTSHPVIAAPPVIEATRTVIRTQPNGSVFIQGSVVVTDADGLGGVTATVERSGVFGPNFLSPSPFVSPTDSATRDRYRGNIFLAPGQFAGNYSYSVSDGTTTINAVDSIPAGLTPFAPAGPTTIDTSTGLLTPTVSIAPVPGATHYFVIGLNDTDSTLFTVPATAPASTSPTIQIPGGLLVAGKQYRLRIVAWNATPSNDATLRSDSINTPYDPATGTVGVAPVISSPKVHLLTNDKGDVFAFPSARVTDSDGIGLLDVTVERVSTFGPFPLSNSRFINVSDSVTSDSFSQVLFPPFLAEGDFAGNYLITVNDPSFTVSTTVSLPSGLTALPAGGVTNIDTSTGILTPTVSTAAIPGATHYRLTISNDTDETVRVFDGVSGADLSSTPSFVIPGGFLEAGKFYRMRIQGFDGMTFLTSNRRSESRDVCYDSTTGASDGPCLINAGLFLRTNADGVVGIQPSFRVEDFDGFDTLDVTLERNGVFGPFPLFTSRFLGPNDTSTSENFSGFFDTDAIPAAQRAGDYEFKADDSTTVGHLTRTLPAGLTPLPAAGPITIDDSTGALTPTITAAPVPGATHYRLVILNDTDTTVDLFDGIPGSRMASSPNFVLLDGVLEAGKAYRIRLDAFNNSTFFTSRVRSRGPFAVYDPSSLDTDGDGIENGADPQPAVASGDFSNVPSGGNVTGTIIDPSDLDISVNLPTNPATGVIITASGGGTGTATVEACGVEMSFTDGDSVFVNCGSLIADVLEGPIEIELPGDITVNVPTGAIATVTETAPDQFDIENSGDSQVPITVEAQGEVITIEPGGPSASIINVEIDIRPFFKTNIIFRRSPFSVPVAILSSSDFDAPRRVDRSSVTFGRTGDEASARRCWRQDVNRDRKRDLVCSFRIRQTGFQRGDKIGVLKGQTKSGELIQGTDKVKIISLF